MLASVKLNRIAVKDFTNLSSPHLSPSFPSLPHTLLTTLVEYSSRLSRILRLNSHLDSPTNFRPSPLNLFNARQLLLLCPRSSVGSRDELTLVCDLLDEDVKGLTRVRQVRPFLFSPSPHDFPTHTDLYSFTQLRRTNFPSQGRRDGSQASRRR